MGFTTAELAEMARADAEIEASFCITNEEIALSRALDRASVLDNMDPKKRKVAESQRRYYEANKDKVAESKRAILNLRKRLGLSQKQFSVLFGVSQMTVSNWERVKAPKNWKEICEQYTQLTKEEPSVCLNSMSM